MVFAGLLGERLRWLASLMTTDYEVFTVSLLWLFVLALWM